MNPQCFCRDVEIGSYANQVTLPRPPHMVGRSEGSRSDFICIDACLVGEIVALWNAGIATTGCCCGHNQMPAYIGVINEHIPAMKAMGYQVRPNECCPGAEDGFYPKTTHSQPDMVRASRAWHETTFRLRDEAVKQARRDWARQASPEAKAEWQAEVLLSAAKAMRGEQPLIWNRAGWDYAIEFLEQRARQLETPKPCPGCDAIAGEFHSPECPTVDAFAAGRIPETSQEPSVDFGHGLVVRGEAAVQIAQAMNREQEQRFAATVAKRTAYTIRDRLARVLDRELDEKALELIEDIATEYAQAETAPEEAAG